MLNRLPKDTGDFAGLLADLGHHTAPEIAKSLGVSTRTIERWKKHGAPRTALLSLWWLSHQGHDYWDCEMANRTRLALQLKDSLWRAVKRQRSQIDALEAELANAQSRPVWMARNDPSFYAKSETRGHEPATR